MANTDKFRRVGKPGTATTLSAPGHTIAGTSITVGSTTNWPTTTGVTFAIDRVTVSGSTETQVAGSYTLWVGDVTGATTIANMTLHSDSPNSDQNYSAGSTTRVYIPVSTATHNDMITGILAEHNQDGTHDEALITSRTEDTSPDPDADFVLTYDTSATSLKKAKISNLNGSSTGWINDSLPAVSTVTNNGNRSYDIGFASTVASILSPGMRLRTTRTVSAPTQCADLEASSSQYFAKASATGFTTGTTWTFKAKVKPESYTLGVIAALDDGTNVVQMYMNANGTVAIVGGTQAAGDSVTSYQSLELGKWQEVTGSITVGTPTGEIRINDEVVPSVAANSASTTVTINGDETFYIGRNSAGAYFDGKIAQVAIFNAIISDATLATYSSQTMTGSETSCKGFWSLNNTLNDLSASANNLTAFNSAVATNADSPFGQDGSGVTAGTTDYALVMKVSTTTATVQVPEGCTIPTSGGVSAVAYSTTANPYGWVPDKGRWEVGFTSKAQLNTGAVGANVVTNIGSTQFTLPIGSWSDFGYDFGTQITHSGVAFLNMALALSTSSSTVSDYELMAVSPSISASITEVDSRLARRKPLNVSSATVYYLLSFSTNATTVQYINGNTAFGANRIFAIPAGI